MSTIRKFLFDESFDPDDIRRRKDAELVRQAAEAAAAEAATVVTPEPVVPEEPPEPTFSEAELEAARKAARAEGEAAGQQKAQQAVEAKLATAVAQIQPELSRLVEEQKLSDAALTEHAAQVGITVCRQLFPDLARKRGMAEVEAVIKDCLTDMIDEPRLVIRVNDDLLDAMRGRLSALSSETGFGGAVVLMADPNLGPSDCRVDWADGGAERVADQLWTQVDRAIARFLEYPQLAPAEPDASLSGSGPAAAT